MKRKLTEGLIKVPKNILEYAYPLVKESITSQAVFVLSGIGKLQREYKILHAYYQRRFKSIKQKPIVVEIGSKKIKINPKFVIQKENSTFNLDTGTITIVFPAMTLLENLSKLNDADAYRYLIRDYEAYIEDGVEHELSHAMQMFVYKPKGATYNMRGNSTSNIVDYVNHDVEFHTSIRTLANMIKRRLMMNRVGNDINNKKVDQKLIKDYIKSEILFVIEQSSFFKYQRDPQKKKRAMALLYVEVWDWFEKHNRRTQGRR